MFKKTLLLILVFMLGVIATNIYAYHTTSNDNINNNLKTFINNDGSYEFRTENTLSRTLAILTEPVEEKPSPKDRISEEQIRVTKDKIEINLKNAEWAEFTDTNSMDPIIDSEAHAIEIIPKNEEDIQVGDIVAYESEYAKGSIIHRIVYQGKDEKGTYYVMKGDNNPTSDPGRIRFKQIKRVVVAIIYWGKTDEW